MSCFKFDIHDHVELEIYLQFLSEKEEKRPIKKKGENSNPFSHWLRQCIKRGEKGRFFVLKIALGLFYNAILCHASNLFPFFLCKLFFFSFLC